MSKVFVKVCVDDQRLDAPKSAALEGFSFSAVMMSRSVFVAERLRMTELHKGGIYFQMGSERDELGRLKIYIGESHDFVERFASHSSQRTGLHNWTTAIFFIDGSIEKDLKRSLVMKKMLSCLNLRTLPIFSRMRVLQ